MGAVFFVLRENLPRGRLYTFAVCRLISAPPSDIMRESTKGENAVKHPAYRYLLLDLDDTLLDWHKTEREALVKVIREMYSRELTEENVLCYNRINARCWKRLELREITKDELKAIRFSEFLTTLGITEENGEKVSEERVREVNSRYMQILSDIVIEMPDAARVCRELAKRYELILITNGTDWVQRGRLSKVSFADCLRGVVISDEVGCNKPAAGFFDGVKAITGDPDVSHYMVIGDSQSSDIAFGRAIGADTCWVHLRDDGQAGDATYTVSSLAEVAALLL